MNDTFRAAIWAATMFAVTLLQTDEAVGWECVLDSKQTGWMEKITREMVRFARRSAMQVQDVAREQAHDWQ